MEVRSAPVIEVAEQSPWAFIVGAPRCGTTSLCGYLLHHPEVCLSSVKEPHFFAAHDLRGLSDHSLRLKVRDNFLNRYFPERKPSQLLAEGSVTYLYVPEQLEPILRLWPKAKFIVGVRNPLTLIPSLHQRLCYNGDETVSDFARAWALVPERREGRSVPRSCAHARWLDYWEAGRLGKYVGRLFDVVGRERCFVYTFEDFIADPAKLYAEMLEFLELPADVRQTFPTHRPSRHYKIGWLQRILKRPPRSMVSFGGERYRRIFEDGSAGAASPMAKALWDLRDRILRWNRAPAPELHISPELREEMIAMYRDDVALLGQLLGRDFSGWIGEPQADGEPVAGVPPMREQAQGFASKRSAGFP